MHARAVFWRAGQRVVLSRGREITVQSSRKLQWGFGTAGFTCLRAPLAHEVTPTVKKTKKKQEGVRWGDGMAAVA